MSKYTEEYKAPPEEEINKLVQCLVGNSVFTSLHVPEDMLDMVPSIFMPIALGAVNQMFDDPDEALEFRPVFYEYMEKAGPRSVNGLPMFMSFRVMSGDDWLNLVLPKYKAAMEAINPNLKEELSNGNKDQG